MSEEKPELKVTDRRLFNSDGTPRADAVREETPPPATETASIAESLNADSVASATSPTVASSAAGASGTVSSESVSVDATSSQQSTHAAATGHAPESTQSAATEDPTAFVNLLMFIASPAAAALGLTEHPGLNAGEVDLPLAKHCIDLLGTLRQKTARNLTPQENQILEDLLAELRMQFVSLSGGRAPSSPLTGSGGFTGGDITGAK